MSVIEDIRAGLKMVPNAINGSRDGVYSAGVTAAGKKHTPNVLQKMGCISVFAVPIVGGGDWRCKRNWWT